MIVTAFARAARAALLPGRGMLYCLSSSRRVVSVAAVVEWSVGEWLSLVEHLVRDQGVGGSNPLSPTICSQLLTAAAGTPKPSHIVLHQDL